MDKYTGEKKALNMAKILVDACLCQPIQGWIVLRLSGHCFDVFVKRVVDEV